MPPQESAYGTVEALWNADSYWVNLQLDASGAVAPAAGCAFNLADKSAWRAFGGDASGAGPFHQQGPTSGMKTAFYILVPGSFQIPEKTGLLLVVCHKRADRGFASREGNGDSAFSARVLARTMRH